MNQWVLHKQHLTQNSKAERNNICEVAKKICGLHAQVPTTPYLSLWNRIDHFQKEDLIKELYEKQTLVKLWGMRATVHIIPTEQVIEYYQATKRAGGRNSLILGPIHEKILKILDKSGPLTTQDLSQHIGELKKKIQTPYGEMSAGQLAIRELTQSTIVTPVKPKGNWKSNLHTYTNFRKWLPSVKLESLNEQQAKKRLIINYLSGFGPAMVEDIAWWIGITMGETKKVLEVIDDAIDKVNVNGLEGDYIMLKSDLKQMQSFSPGNDTLCLLPKFDSYIMGYKNRQRLIATKHEKEVYLSKRAEVCSTILLKGDIIGTWKYKEETSKITIDITPFDTIDEHYIVTIKDQAEKMAQFIGEGHQEITIMLDGNKQV